MSWVGENGFAVETNCLGLNSLELIWNSDFIGATLGVKVGWLTG